MYEHCNTRIYLIYFLDLFHSYCTLIEMSALFFRLKTLQKMFILLTIVYNRVKIIFLDIKFVVSVVNFNKYYFFIQCDNNTTFHKYYTSLYYRTQNMYIMLYIKHILYEYPKLNPSNFSKTFCWLTDTSKVRFDAFIYSNRQLALCHLECSVKILVN